MSLFYLKDLHPCEGNPVKHRVKHSENADSKTRIIGLTMGGLRSGKKEEHKD